MGTHRKNKSWRNNCVGVLFRLVLASRLRLSLSSCVEAVSLYDSFHHYLRNSILLGLVDSATHKIGHGAESTRLGRDEADKACSTGEV